MTGEEPEVHVCVGLTEQEYDVRVVQIEGRFYLSVDWHPGCVVTFCPCCGIRLEGSKKADPA